MSCSAAAAVPVSSSSLLETYIALVRPEFIFLMVGTVMGAMYIPMLLALFYFSTASLRRSPVFLLNVTAILFGFALAGFNGYSTIHTIFSPADGALVDNFVAYAALSALGPVLVEAILLLRLIAVFPLQMTPLFTWLSIMTFPFLMKTARIVNIAICLHFLMQQAASSQSSPIMIAAKITNQINYEIEWFLQVFDNMYLSCVFLWKLRTHTTFSRDFPRANAAQSVSRRVNVLFWLATTNFVFPVLLNIAQLVIYMSSSDSTVAFYVQQVNCHFCIIGIVFATIWSTGSVKTDSKTRISEIGRANPEYPTASSESFRFNRPTIPSFSTIDPFSATDSVSCRNTLEMVRFYEEGRCIPTVYVSQKPKTDLN